MQVLNNDVIIKAKIPNGHHDEVGYSELNKYRVDTRPVKAKSSFNGLNDYIEMDNLNLLSLNTERNKRICNSNAK